MIIAVVYRPHRKCRACGMTEIGNHVGLDDLSGIPCTASASDAAHDWKDLSQKYLKIGEPYEQVIV